MEIDTLKYKIDKYVSDNKLIHMNDKLRKEIKDLLELLRNHQSATLHLVNVLGRQEALDNISRIEKVIKELYGNIED